MKLFSIKGKKAFPIRNSKDEAVFVSYWVHKWHGQIVKFAFEHKSNVMTSDNPYAQKALQEFKEKIDTWKSNF